MFGLALPDTFGSKLFFKSFDKPLNSIDATSAFNGKRFGQIFSGLRNDSGDPMAFTSVAKQYYLDYAKSDQAEHHASPQRTLMFSETEEMDLNLCLEWTRVAHEAGFKTIYAVGSDFYGK
jgi:nicotinate phosphoribosyltransferase